LTYHESTPDGETVKEHLNSWLQRLRSIAPGAKYLWILEFQSRGVPHFHVWLTVPYSEHLAVKLGAAWNRIAEPASTEHLWWHTKERVNRATGKVERSFMPWAMKGAGYLRKYMSKEAQKCVPDGFGFVGRFWGASRGLVPAPMVIEGAHVPHPAGLTRTISKWVEARRRRGAAVARKIARDKGWKHKAVKLRPTVRAQPRSGWLNNAAPAFWRYLIYLEDQEAQNRAGKAQGAK
jgi:hypothetical protein